jgi:hypothetical protein
MKNSYLILIFKNKISKTKTYNFFFDFFQFQRIEIDNSFILKYLKIKTNGY